MADEDDTRPPRWLEETKPAQAEPGGGLVESAVARLLRRLVGRRQAMQGAAGWAAAAAANPSLAARAAAAVAQTGESPLATITPYVVTYPAAVALLGANIASLNEISFLFPISGAAIQFTKTDYLADIESAFGTGIAHDTAERLTPAGISGIHRIIRYMDELNLYNDGRLRLLRFSEITPTTLRDAIDVSENKALRQLNEPLDQSAKRLQHAFTMLRRLADIENSDTTLGECADILRQKSIQLVERILQNPQLMPSSLSAQTSIYNSARHIMHTLDKNDPELSQLMQRISAVADETIEKAGRQSELAESTGETAFRPLQKISYKVLLMQPRTGELGQVFLLQPSIVIKGNDVIPNIRHFCQQLKAEGILQKNFRAASVKSEWLVAAGAEGNNTVLGMRITTADPELKAYLGNLASSGESIAIPIRAQQHVAEH